MGFPQTHSRGSAICANNQTISERRAIEGVVAALRDTLLDPEKLRAFIAEFLRKVAQVEASATDDSQVLADRMRDAEREVGKLVDLLTQASWSDAIGGRLKNAEERLAKLKVQAASAAAPRGKILVHPKMAETYLAKLIGLLGEDPVKGREALARHVRPMELTPAVENGRRIYKLRGDFNLTLALNSKTPDPCGSEVLSNQSSGGAIRGLEHAPVLEFEQALIAPR